MPKEILYGTVEQIFGRTAVIQADTTEDLFQCERYVTSPSLQSGDIVRFTTTPQGEVDDIAIDYTEIKIRYASA